MDHDSRLTLLIARLEAVGCDTTTESGDGGGANESGENRSGVDAMLITEAAHVRYLTGFSGSAGFVLVAADAITLFTDKRYGEVAGDALQRLDADVDLFVGNKSAQAAAARSFGVDRRRIGLEADSVSWSDARRYRTDWFPDSGVVATSGVVAGLRLIKDRDEVDRIEAAAEITDEALSEIQGLLASEPTERAFRLALDRAILDAGADDLSFPTIVASGPNAARPHHVPGERTIEDGDLVIVDVGALVDGYHSDMTRTFVVGGFAAELSTMFDVVLEAQATGVAAVRPGISGEDVDAAARDVVVAGGLGGEFIHGVGHGVGLEIHEDPFLAGSSVLLREGQVVTVEPGVYRSGVGGVRIEDTVVVTGDGCRVLTKSPKNPVV